MSAVVTNLPTITPVNISGQRVFAFLIMFNMFAYMYIKMKTLNELFEVYNEKYNDQTVLSCLVTMRCMGATVGTHK